MGGRRIAASIKNRAGTCAFFRPGLCYTAPLYLSARFATVAAGLFPLLIEHLLLAIGLRGILQIASNMGACQRQALCGQHPL